MLAWIVSYCLPALTDYSSSCRCPCIRSFHWALQYVEASPWRFDSTRYRQVLRQRTGTFHAKGLGVCHLTRSICLLERRCSQAKLVLGFGYRVNLSSAFEIRTLTLCRDTYIRGSGGSMSVLADMSVWGLGFVMVLRDGPCLCMVTMVAVSWFDSRDRSLSWDRDRNWGLLSSYVCSADRNDCWEVGILATCSVHILLSVLWSWEDVIKWDRFRFVHKVEVRDDMTVVSRRDQQKPLATTLYFTQCTISKSSTNDLVRLTYRLHVLKYLRTA